MNYHQFAPDPDKLSDRILRSGAATGAVLPGDSRAAGPPNGTQAAPVELPATVAGLTSLRDRAFIDAAYRVVLGREPDPAGSEHYLGQLRAGTLDKIDILGDLRYSAEGRQRGVALAGLRKRYALRRVGRLRLVGGVFRWLTTLLRLPTVVQVTQRHQAEMELAQIVAESHATAIQRFETGVRELRGETRRVSTRIETAENALNELLTEARNLSTRVEAAENSLRILTATLAATELTFEARHQHLTAATARITQQLRTMSASRPSAGSASDAPPAPPPSGRDRTAEAFDAFYLDFEDRFRGPREETKRTQEIYLDYVAVAGAGTPSAPVVDVGCGRGEWLELLLEHGCVARGVDLNRAMVAENAARGLDVVERDVLAYLAELPDGSLGMVTGFHLIEHLPFELLVRLLDECRRVLKPGGCVLFETPNPENLVVGAYTFYFDPTHRNPLPPQLVEFLVQQHGYADVEVLRLHPRAERGSDDALLDKWFRSPTDYAVIGWKDGRGALAR